jgi:TfoX/Sxy family transcriptional regulator of competence genes
VAFDDVLAERVRARLDARSDVEERRMFGGIGFLIAGNMCCGVHGDELIVRVGPDEGASLLEEDGTRPFDITGRPMRGWLFVSPDATAEDADLERWVRRAEAFAAGLPPKISR